MAKINIEEFIASLKEMTVVELNELVKAIETEFLITAYVGTLDKVYAMYKSAGLEIPASLKKKILRNKKRNYVELQNKG